MQKKNIAGKSLLLGSLLAASSAAPVLAGGKIAIDDTRWISVGAGIRTSIASVSDAAPDGSSSASNFNLENMRLYISGQATKDFKFYFGTDRMWDGEYGVLDAIIQYEPGKAFNVWMGRMLTPADRIEMNGPFYSLTWGQYTVPLYPSDNDIGNGANGGAGTYGRDEGVTAWGALGKFQYAVGIFDGYNGDENQSDAPLFAARFAYNLLNMEENPGYYTSSTYFGKGGDILTLAISAQSQDDGYGTVTQSGSFTGYAIDGLFEKPLGGGAAVTVEAEYKSFEVSTDAATPVFSMFDGEAYFASAAYLLGNTGGSGMYQPYVRYTENSPSVGDSSSLTEVGVNYIVSGQNLKLNLNFTTGDANASGAKAATDVDAITFGMQFQI
ncbi:MAG: OprO/OprP family phosphate-selective porin [Gammaproteobacteria bacterium]|nr:OprO/OprP family phosphate-selective porin [Gammaproteobacteria bacterium]